MIQLKNITKIFGDKVLFDNFCYEIKANELVAIVGTSGAGKSTLLNIMSGLEKPTSGEVYIEHQLLDYKKVRQLYQRKISFLFQNFALVDEWTVVQNLKIALRYSDYTEKDIDSVLAQVGLSGKNNVKIYSLSGGEQQRVALARLILQNNDIILADEPTGALDKVNRDVVINILKTLKQRGKTIVIVTHDLELAQQCDKILNID